MIDPILSLSHSMQTNKGGYALLLGSGVSRSASIPTGWEIVIDLIRKIAAMDGANVGPDPIAWFRTTYSKEPDYSILLEQLARSPEERRSLLSPYFEPSVEEKEHGLKLPTKAHRAIAKLVGLGTVRVVLTTNFDRLLERALDDEGITPIVLSTPDAIEGALPLVHQKCCVIKLHGDYLDTRIKNSINELSTYDKRVNRLLDQVLDEFGLVVCGWSGQWDEALRTAFMRCKSRRFSTYWALRGKLVDQAKQLVTHRSAVLTQVKDADEFFESLREKIESLEEIEQSHPMSFQIATATAKRLLVDDRGLIRLHDLLQNETEIASEGIVKSFERLLNDNALFPREIETILESMRTLFGYLVPICLWGKKEHADFVCKSISRLGHDPNAGKSGTHLVSAVRAIPSVIALYLCGVAAVSRGNYLMLAAVLEKPFFSEHGKREKHLTAVDWTGIPQFFKQIPGFESKHVPASEWLCTKLPEFFVRELPTSEEFARCFDLFETIRSLAFVEITVRNANREIGEEEWGPPGRFAYLRHSRGRSSDYLRLILDDIELQENLATSGLFSNDPTRVSKTILAFQKMVEKFRMY